MHLFKAIEGGWQDVAHSSGETLSFTAVDPGAYRAEVRIVPMHLRSYMGHRLDLMKDDRPWVYSNAIYVK
jgi:hypothetical protein